MKMDNEKNLDMGIRIPIFRFHFAGIGFAVNYIG